MDVVEVVFDEVQDVGSGFVGFYKRHVARQYRYGAEPVDEFSQFLRVTCGRNGEIVDIYVAGFFGVSPMVIWLDLQVSRDLRGLQHPSGARRRLVHASESNQGLFIGREHSHQILG